MKISEEFKLKLMQAALAEASKAITQEEVPVGAVIAKDGEIIARAHNLVEQEKNVVQHAEVLAIQSASRVIGDWRLIDCVLCVTLEPCSMCAGAIKLARIGTVIFGAHDSNMGAFGSLFDLSQDPRIGPVPRVISGVLQEECGQILKDFFVKRRKR